MSCSSTPETIIRTEPIPYPVIQYVEIPKELLDCDYAEIQPWMDLAYALIKADEATTVCRLKLNSIKVIQSETLNKVEK